MLVLYIIVTVVTITLIAKNLLMRDKFPSIPNSKGLPLLGNALQIRIPRAHLLLADWAKKYGTLYKINLFGTPVIVVSGYKEMQELFVIRGKDFAGREDSYRLKEAFPRNFDFMDREPDQIKLKKMFMHHLKAYGEGMKSIENTTISVISEHIDQLKKKITSPISVKDMVSNVVLDIMEIITFGNKGVLTIDEKKRIFEINAKFPETMNQGGSGTLLDIFPWLRFLGNKTARQICEICGDMRQLYDEWKKRMETEDGNFLMKMVKAVNENEVGDDEAMMNVWFMFIDGISTTASALESLINILVHHPDIQEKLCEESKLLDGDITYNNRDKLPYHQAVILETLRYVTPSPVTPHKSMVNTQLDGIFIPQNTVMWVNLWFLHHNELTWEDPFQFRPERFLDVYGNLVPADHPNRQNLLPFGAGPRVCPGENFAKTRLLLLLAFLVKEFKFLPKTTIEEHITCDLREILQDGLVLAHPDFEIRLESSSL